ncbi:MAG TPA: hypothetical protein VGP99_04885 [Tepidisphaeraceae bacterium]|jgi:hypothetical protein|nr:hypothetical protein [Tepidisphaeraceae bacterium]
MTEDPNPAPSNPSVSAPEVLSYSTAPAHPSGPRILLRTFLVLLGGAIGVVATVALGVFIWGLAGYDLNHSPSTRPIWPSILFGALFVAGIGACIFAFRRFRRTAKWFLMGLLLGVGGYSLVEGICFLNQ